MEGTSAILQADVQALLGEADALLLVPPFATITRPYLAAHLLQATARQRGLDVAVLYANLLFAEEIGPEAYFELAYAGYNILSERVFAPAAFGSDPDDLEWDENVLRLQPAVTRLIDITASVVAQRQYLAVGASTTFFQTTASVALLGAIKEMDPEVVTLVGGANCRAEMAQGMASLSPAIDYVFSGECEELFADFLEQIARGERPETKTYDGGYTRDLDSLPLPDFTEYFQQREYCLPGREFDVRYDGYIPYETSRGCWWGAKHHCRFCGNNDGRGSMGYRAKSPDRVMDDLRTLLERHDAKKVHMTDNVMPYEYFDTLLPRLERELPGLTIFYAQKANLDFERVCSLSRAGVRELQVGIEAFSTPLLTLMDKGITGRQNINFLRSLEMMNIWCCYLLLYGLPGDKAAYYEQTLELLPAIHHLRPPLFLNSMDVLRFSPFHQRSRDFGLSNIRPAPVYDDLFPPEADKETLAFSFEADFESGSLRSPDVITALEERIERWQALWKGEDAADGPEPPVLRIEESDGAYLLHDTRGIDGLEKRAPLSREEATLALVGHPVPHRGPALERCLALKLVVNMDGWYVPLATASETLFRQFMA